MSEWRSQEEHAVHDEKPAPSEVGLAALRGEQLWPFDRISLGNDINLQRRKKDAIYCLSKHGR
jgi:hypothetical protein